jgi:4-amino-4-deoxy-L-arabinose transferase-like glycosyltransferase
MGLFRRLIIQFTFLALGLLLVGGCFAPLPDISPISPNPLSNFLTFLGRGLFGATPLGQRIFPLIFGVVGLISTYKLGFLLYNKRIGFVAALLLGTNGFFYSAHLANHSNSLVLMGLTTFSVWHLMEVVYYQRQRNLGFAGLALAAGVYAGGLWALFLPVLAMLAYFVGKGQWNTLLKRDWLYLGLIISGLLAPYIFYLMGQPPVELLDTCTLKSHFIPAWQNFLIQDFASIFFVCDADAQNFTTHLLAFLIFGAPWSLAIVIAILWRLVNLISMQWKHEKVQQEWLNPGAFFIPLAILLMAPGSEMHHFLVMLPFAAIMTSEFLLRLLLENEGLKSAFLRIGQMIFTALAVLVTAYLNMQYNDWQHITWPIFLILIGWMFLHWKNKDEPLDQAIMATILAGLWLMSFLFFNYAALFN